MSAEITPRDRKLLCDCISSCFLSFEQIHWRFFRGRAESTVSNRLKALEKKGMIKSQKVGIFIHNGIPKQINRIYEATNKAKRFLHIPIDFRQKTKSPKSYVALYHDLVLNDVLYEMVQKEINFDFRVSSNIKSNLETDIVPDALLYPENEEKPIAVELELTAKSEKRYRELFLKYRFSKDFSKVIYICGNQNILKKIERILRDMGISFEDRFMSFKLIDDYFRGARVKSKVKSHF